LHQAAVNPGEQTFRVGNGFWSRFKAEKTSLMLAEDYAAKNKVEALQAYLGIFRSLTEEFKERRFALIFDQFESVGKASTDFLLNFKFLTPQERFDLVVSFKTDDTTWNDPAARKLYQDLERYNLGAKKIPIEGLPRRCLR
jgi:hypothetical protein